MRGAWVTAAVPFVAAAGAFMTLHRMHGSLAEDSLYFIVGILGVGAAALGSLVAALAFDAGDYMRRAWLLQGMCYGTLVLNTLLFRSAGHASEHVLSPAAAATSGLFIIVANVASVLGNLRIARAWRVAGLDLRVPAEVRWGAAVASLALALAIVGSTLSQDAQALFGGDWGSLSSTISDLGDVITLALVAPILLTAFALRGGSLAWPWALLSLSSLGWLFYDAAGPVSSALALESAAQRPLEAALRVFACLAQLSAGLLQASVLAESEQSLPMPALRR
ncbi:hypothetical protein FGE12_06680 [Aggregicoccus sp. 17bor-14]|uniref:hypothetical protein n=1 Tax=Myxococcaceae TaxID=31 RepID=UPI00129C2B95|nr:MULTISPECIES: hypothetical protein [Myxococcaceae]MBF5042074.1 hypothetical protein [Simulacricoccus sp. 17bor-14]MRI87852.1 hypothetical protein [Aggregicoccus sp. 17bor-14]